MSRNKKSTNNQSRTQLAPSQSNSEKIDGLSSMVRTSEPKRPLTEVGSQVLPGTSPVPDRMLSAIRHEKTTFNGPIPHPDIFRKYGEVVADAPERILKVFEEDSKHSRELQMKALEAQKGDNRRVHWMAWSLIAGGYLMSLVFALLNKDVLAGIVLTTTIIGTVTGFLQNKKNIADDVMDDDKDSDE